MSKKQKPEPARPPRFEPLRAAALAVAALAVLPAIACTAPTVVRNGSFALPAGAAKVVLAQDKGEVLVVTGKPGQVSYEVTFSKSFWGGDPEKGVASANEAERKITVQAGLGGHAKTVLFVPADAAIDVRFGEGTVGVARRPSAVEASVANGLIEFDSADTPKKACFKARATNGTISSPWGEKQGTGVEVGTCDNPHVALTVGNGNIDVR